MARTQTPPNLQGQPSIDFRKNDFEATIWNKGYSVLLESARSCPCKVDSTNNPSCKNCRGFGYFFINPIKVKGVMSSINKSTQYKEWSPQLVGTANITLSDDVRPYFMDRITFVDEYSILNEIKTIRGDEDEYYIFTTYKIRELVDVFVFNTESTSLIKIPNSDCEIITNGYGLKIDYDFSSITDFNGSISINYKHELQYHVIDTPHDVRSSPFTDSRGRTQINRLPLSAIIRRAQHVLGFTDKDGSLNDNSYL